MTTGCLLLMGRLADLFGQRRSFLTGFLIFTVGSTLCGFSSTISFLIGSRIIQGLGASSPFCLFHLSSSFSESSRSGIQPSLLELALAQPDLPRSIHHRGTPDTVSIGGYPSF